MGRSLFKPIFVSVCLACVGCTSDKPIPLLTAHEQCMGQHFEAAVRAAACQKLIDAPPDEGRIMSTIHHFRAIALAEMEQFDLAIKHYDASIRL